MRENEGKYEYPDGNSEKLDMLKKAKRKTWTDI